MKNFKEVVNLTLCIREDENRNKPSQEKSQYFPNSIPTKSQTNELTAAESEELGAEQIAESDHGFKFFDFESTETVSNVFLNPTNGEAMTIEVSGADGVSLVV